MYTTSKYYILRWNTLTYTYLLKVNNMCLFYSLSHDSALSVFSDDNIFAKKCRFFPSLFLDFRNFRVLVHYVNRKDSIMISNLILSLFYESQLFRSQCSTFWMFLVCENIKNVQLSPFKNDLNEKWKYLQHF